MSDHEQPILEDNAKSVAGKPLPAIPPAHKHAGSILLFYQYQEPAWTSKEHKQVLKDVIKIGETHKITGRGRVAPEGLNCTLSGDPQDIRDFCNALRKYNHLFQNTDFKITDGVARSQLFKSLSIRKTQELVAYGLAGERKAPSLQKFAGQHLEAPDYHKAMEDTNTVIIDVRNAYESAIGNFQPPPGGAELIDPKMRNSIEFPKWLADERTQKKLNGKKVLMYCTGGIRCERATALVNELSKTKPEFKPEAVYELQGGIERYLKTFPKGGYWAGKNYLFDRRMEQVPEEKPKSEVEQDIQNAKCAVCRTKWTRYRGKFKCSQGLCGVPVIVCDGCRDSASNNPKQLLCDLCRAGTRHGALMPDVASLKRKAERDERDGGSSNKKQATNDRNLLFLSKLPLTATKSKLIELLGPIKGLHWLTDKKTGAFYGSCMVQLESAEDSVKITNAASIKLDKKKIKAIYCRQDQEWPPPSMIDKEFPPVGC